MPIKIHNKEYFTVAERIAQMRRDHPDWSVVTEMKSSDDERVVFRAAILNGETIIATGYAEEDRSASKINQTSAVENCETSAVGRALSFAGYAGGEIASADEVVQAIGQQDLTAALMKGIEHGQAFVKLSDSIQAIKDGIAEGQLDMAAEAWRELSAEEKALLWVAPSKGGPFSTEERNIMKSTEFREA